MGSEMCIRDRDTVGALAAEVGQPILHSGRKAIQSLRQHERECVFARTCGTSQNHRLGKVIPRQHVTQAMDDVGIAAKITEAHIHHGDIEAQRKPKRKFSSSFVDAQCIDDTTFG